MRALRKFGNQLNETIIWTLALIGRLTGPNPKRKDWR